MVGVHGTCCQAESLRTSAAALRADYVSKMEALSARVEAVQGTQMQTAADAQVGKAIMPGSSGQIHTLEGGACGCGVL